MNLTGLRVTVGPLLAVAWSVAAYWAMPFVFYPAPTLGWLYASGVFALGLGIAALVVGGRKNPVPLGVAAVLSVGLGVACWYHMEPDLDRVRAVADSIPVPDGWERASGYGNESELFGGGATHVSRTYLIGTEPPTAALADLVTSMEDEGWAVAEESGPPRDRTVLLTSGRWQAQVTRGSDGSGIRIEVHRAG